MKYSTIASLDEISMVFIRDPLDYGQPPPDDYWGFGSKGGFGVADVLNDDIIINGMPGFEHFAADMFGF
jgi:hypothetical protein